MSRRIAAQFEILSGDDDMARLKAFTILFALAMEVALRMAS